MERRAVAVERIRRAKAAQPTGFSSRPVGVRIAAPAHVNNSPAPEPHPHPDDTLDEIGELYAHDEISDLEMETRIAEVLAANPNAK